MNVILNQDGNEENRIIEFVDQVLIEAINKNASDIHFELLDEVYRIRFRIDGILYEVINLEPKFAGRITARLKIMANLDIAERRMPKDGHFKIKGYDCRISACPMLYGEKIVVRILNPNNSLLAIDELGLDELQIESFYKTIKHQQGMILVTGPTGSGKTVSLYAFLNSLNNVHKNISTVEDPVEINLNGINQVNIHPKIGLDFAFVLRSFLRQDPDIIMIGEIRDLETAEIAIKASQTGHLVFSTLHTNSAAEGIARLLNMGISAFNLDNSLSLIMAQRLVRKLCPECKCKQQMLPEILLKEGFMESEIAELNIYTAVGCKNCNEGFRGRIGIFELLPISSDISQMIIQHQSVAKIFSQACVEGMTSLRRSALNKVRDGITSISEINRVVNA